MGSAAGGSGRLIRGTRESSAPSPERAAGARRPHRAATGAVPAEPCPAPPSPARPRGGAGARGSQRGPPPGNSSVPALLPEAAPAAVRRAAAPGRDKQRRPAALRPLPARRHGARRQLPHLPRAPPGPPLGSPPGPGPRGPCALPPGTAAAPCAAPCAPRGLLSPGAQLLLRPELAAALFVYFPAAVAGCQARGPFLLKTHFSCPARSGSLLAALRCAVKRKRGRVLPGAGGGGWSRACPPPTSLPGLPGAPGAPPAAAAAPRAGVTALAPGRAISCPPEPRPAARSPSPAAERWPGHGWQRGCGLETPKGGGGQRPVPLAVGSPQPGAPRAGAGAGPLRASCGTLGCLSLPSSPGKS